MVKLLAVLVYLPALVFRTKALMDENFGRPVDVSTPLPMFRESMSESAENLQRFAATVLQSVAVKAVDSFLTLLYLVRTWRTCKLTTMFFCSQFHFFI